MNSSGKVGLNGYTPSSTYGLSVSNGAQVSGELRSSTAYFTSYVTSSTDATLKIAGVHEGTTYNSFIAYGNGKINGTVAVTSDKRLKKNIQPLQNSLEKLLQISGKRYEYKDYSEIKASGIKGYYKYRIDSVRTEGGVEIINEEEQAFTFSQGQYLGVLAQEVQPLFPELVHLDEASGVFYVDYNGFVPVFIEAFKEQQSRIDEQQVRISELEAAVIELRHGKQSGASGSRIGTIETTESPLKGASLSQNYPNPSSAETNISLKLPRDVQHANLLIYNLQGVQLKKINITQRGESTITLPARELQAGVYLYSLLADGVEVATKKMILTD